MTHHIVLYRMYGESRSGICSYIGLPYIKQACHYCEAFAACHTADYWKEDRNV